MGKYLCIVFLRVQQKGGEKKPFFIFRSANNTPLTFLRHPRCINAHRCAGNSFPFPSSSAFTTTTTINEPAHCSIRLFCLCHKRYRAIINSTKKLFDLLFLTGTTIAVPHSSPGHFRPIQLSYLRFGFGNKTTVPSLPLLPCSWYGFFVVVHFPF